MVIKWWIYSIQISHWITCYQWAFLIQNHTSQGFFSPYIPYLTCTLRMYNMKGSIEYPIYQEYDSRQDSDKQLEPLMEPIASHQSPKPKFNLVGLQSMPRLGGLDTVYAPAHNKYHSSHHKTKPKPQKSKIVDPKDTYLCKVSFQKQFCLNIFWNNKTIQI